MFRSTLNIPWIESGSFFQTARPRGRNNDARLRVKLAVSPGPSQFGTHHRKLEGCPFPKFGKERNRVKSRKTLCYIILYIWKRGQARKECRLSIARLPPGPRRSTDIRIMASDRVFQGFSVASTPRWKRSGSRSSPELLW